MFSKMKTMKYTNGCSQIEQLTEKIHTADAIVIGAGAGMSTSAGYTYSGKRFEDNFSDFIQKYGFKDMYSAGFYPFETLEEHWAYWSRYIYINRYAGTQGDAYKNLLELVKDKDYFVLTTNVDHCFQNAGFDKRGLFYTQGDYGLWQCSKPCHEKTYDNEAIVRKMVAEQKNMRVPSDLIPYCPVCGAPMSMNLRADGTFVEDKGWHEASARYQEFLRRHTGLPILFLELGVGGNTPGIIKYPFWQMTYQNAKAIYAYINLSEACIPAEIRRQSISIAGDIGTTLERIKEGLSEQIAKPAEPVDGKMNSRYGSMEI